MGFGCGATFNVERNRIFEIVNRGYLSEDAIGNATENFYKNKKIS